MPDEPCHESAIAPSQRKVKSLLKLQGLDTKFSDGTDYNLQRYIIPAVTLGRVREELSPIHGSLADAVRDDRSR